MDSEPGPSLVRLQRAEADTDLALLVREVWRQTDSSLEAVSLVCQDGHVNIPAVLLPLVLPWASQHSDQDLVILIPSVLKTQLVTLLDLLLTGESNSDLQSVEEVEHLFRIVGLSSVQIERDLKNTDKLPKRKAKADKRSSDANVNFQESIRILTCGVCGVSGDNFYPLLKKHYEMEHFNSKENGFLCPLRDCNKKIINTSSFHSHIHIVHREALYSCELCEKSFKTWSGLSHHKTRWHSTSRSLQCEVCGEGLANALHLQSHMRMHRSTHVCSECDKKFLSAAHLKKHRITHTKERPFACQTCAKTFRDKYSASQCQLRHQGLARLKPSARIPWSQREVRFVCHVCGYKTRAAATLNRHVTARHSSDRTSHCQDCGKQFKSTSSLLSHRAARSKCVLSA